MSSLKAFRALGRVLTATPAALRATPRFLAPVRYVIVMQNSISQAFKADVRCYLSRRYHEKIQYDSQEKPANLVGQYKNPRPVNYEDWGASEVESMSLFQFAARHCRRLIIRCACVCV